MIAGAIAPAVLDWDSPVGPYTAEQPVQVTTATVTAADLAQRLNGRHTPNGWEARCPAHNDNTASLSIAEGQDGRVLITCHAGCTFPAIVAAMGLKPASLFPPKPKCRDRKQGQIVATYDYTDIDDKLRFQVVRFDPKDFRQRRPDGNGGWLWNITGVDRVLYRLPQVIEAVKAGQVIYIAEGEKDVDVLASLGLCATCNPGGAGKWQASYSETLTGAQVIIIADKDAPGRSHATLVSRELTDKAQSVQVIELPDRTGRKVKDAADWITAGGTMAELQAIIAAVPAWAPPKRETPPELPCAENAAQPDPIEAARRGTPYAMTDLGNAERLCAWHGDEIRWDVSRKAWRAWDGRRWAVDDALEVSRRAAKTARKIRQEAAAAPSGNGDTKDLGALLFGWAVKTESRDRLAAMLEVAKARPGIAVASDTLDADPWVLNVLNGTIDLRTGMLRPHNRADLLTKLAPVKYLPGYCCKRWERFLIDATGGDAELIAFLQVVAGYTLTGDTSEEILLLIYGPEAAGKTTFLEALRAAMGEYARTIQADLLTRQRESRGGGAASPELAGLAGARLAAGSEMEQGREIAEALAKNLTGGEPITARHLYAELFDFRPQFKLWLALNHCPKVSADDGAIWRRILRIGFEHTVPPERRDKTLKPYLRDTNGGARAVLAWAIEGCLRWQRNGLRVPAVVKRSTAAYRQESDPLASFIEDCLKFNPAAWTAWGEIWAAYNEHAAESGTGERYRVAPKRLQERLRGHNCVSERCHTGRGWAGVEIQDGWKTGNRDACDGCDTTLQTFSNDSLLEEVFEVPSHPTQPTRSPTQKSAELDKTDHYEDKERAAIQSEGSLTSNRKE